MPAVAAEHVFNVKVKNTKNDRATQNSFLMLAPDGQTACERIERYLRFMKLSHLEADTASRHPESAVLQEQCQRLGGHLSTTHRCSICGYTSPHYLQRN